MAIIKTDVTGQYFVVGMDVARDRRLGLTERGMLLTLLSLPPDWDFSIEGMVSILPDGKSRVRNAFNRLQDLGYVKRNQVRKEDGSYGKGLIEVYHKPIILPTKYLITINLLLIKVWAHCHKRIMKGFVLFMIRRWWIIRLSVSRPIIISVI